MNLEEHFWMIRVVIVLLLLFICFVFFRSWKSFYNKNDNRFKENLYQYRKTLYFIFVIFVGLLAFFRVIGEGDWQVLLMATAMVIFVDIAVFSTPTIKKIWKTEFGVQDDIKEYIQKNDVIAENQQDKLNYFSELVQLSTILKEDIDNKNLNAFDSFELFLSYYPERFGLRMHLYDVAIENRNEEEPHPKFIELIAKIKDTHTLDIETMSNNLKREKGDERANKELALEKLWNGSILALNREEHGRGMAHLCPIFIAEQNIYLIFLEEVSQKVYEMDPLLLTDLAYLYNFIDLDHSATPRRFVVSSSQNKGGNDDEQEA